MAGKRREPPVVTPTEWIEGDPGYEPDDDPAETFFHVIALPDPRDEKMALLIHLAYTRGQPLDLVPGRRYLVNAHSEDDARAQVERLEQQVADNDEEHRVRFGGEVWGVGLVVTADSFLDARRDPEPAAFSEAFVLDEAKAERRRSRAMSSGLA